MSFRRRQNERSIEDWIPRTTLGKSIREGRISSLEEVFMEGLKIREPEIVDFLLPGIREEVININLVQKQTDAGEKSQFQAIVAVGDSDGFIGLGSGKARKVRTAIEKSALNARLNITPVRRGCGSWECGCGKSHSFPFKITGKCGGVRTVLIPGPRGLGLVASEPAKMILGLAGIKDCWVRSYGSTKTVPSFAYSIFYSLKKTYSFITSSDWLR